MKKMAIVLVVMMVCLVGRVFGGGVDIELEVADEKTSVFAGEFMLIMLDKKGEITSFTEDYIVRGYLGTSHNQKTGITESVIGIFLNGKEKPLVIVPCKDLFSRDEIAKKAKEAADYIFQYLKILEEKEKGID